jgi:ubiquitin-activating enzyme E1
MNLDEQLYSRQIVAYGFNAMNKLSKLKILIYRIGGLGIEIAKNIILTGPKKVSIFDDKIIKIEDIGCNFYINEKDIGLRKDEVCLSKLKELNDIQIEILENENIENYIKENDVIVITEIIELEKLIKINEICRENKKGFIYCLSLGLTFYCFVDFGEHIINDLDNKDKKKFFIKDIKVGEKTRIYIDNELENFNLYANSYIIFKEIKGMSQLMNGKKRKIYLSNKNYFEIEENSLKYDKYLGDGIVEEFREPIFMSYKPLSKMLYKPKFCEYMLDDNKNINLHIAFLLIHEYFRINKKLPEKKAITFDEFDYLLKNVCESYYQDFNNIDKNFIYFIFENSKYEISPICGYGGGVVSQEIIKYIGLYKPINQWFTVDFIRILDESVISSLIPNKKSRYSHQISVFGEKTQKNLEDLNIFLIGAGAVGCELLKYFSMMGISTNKHSKIIVADHDRIEKSNLSRQFLFRNKDILKLKAECAVNSVKKMNDKINCEYSQNIVSEKTEKIFNKKFFKKQDAVVIAVDNFEARKYISEKCEKYSVPYFNCGTDGPYANVEAFIPGITEPASYPTNYKKIVPSCTLKMFPSSINHCVIWAYNHFEKLFNENIKSTNNMYNNYEEFFKIVNEIEDLNVRYNKIKKIYYFCKISYNQNFNECIKFCVQKYLKFFKYNIELVLQLYPSNKIDAETGEKFWSGNKRLPHPLEFDLNDNMCFEFIKSFSCLLAKCLDINISKISIDKYIKNYCSTLTLEPKKSKEFKEKLYYEKKINEIKKEIKDFLIDKKKKINFNNISYDKDSTNKYQIDFISNCSNLRARNYNLEQADKFKINVIAGKMIPGIITSTASIAGLLALQLYVICQKKDYRTFMTGSMNLADNTLALAIPLQKIEETKNIRKYHNFIVWKIMYKYLPYFIIVLIVIISFIINK